MDKEHKEFLNTSLLTGFDGRAWSEDFWRQGLSIKMEMGTIKRRMQQTAGCSWGAEAFTKGGGHQKSTLECDWLSWALSFRFPMGIGKCRMSWMLQASWHLETVKFVHLSSCKHKYLCCNYYFFFFFSLSN